MVNVLCNHLVTQLDLILLLHVSRPQTHWSQCQTQYWSIIKKWCRCSTVVGVGLGWDGIWWVSLGRSIEHLTVCRLEGLVEDQDQHHGEEVDHWHGHRCRRCHGNPDGAWGSQKVTDYILTRSQSEIVHQIIFNHYETLKHQPLTLSTCLRAGLWP